MLGQDYRLRHYGKDGYNPTRGEMSLYAGTGLGFDFGAGLTLRFPAGIQYTMRDDPVSFFGGLALMYGRFIADQEQGIQAWFNLGARALL